MLDLVLLRIEILLAARLPWTIFQKLERRTVDSIIAAQCGCEQQPEHKGGTAAELQGFRQNVRRVRPQVRTKVFAHLGLRELLKIFRDLGLGIAPGEITVGLREPQLTEAIHHLWAGKSFGKKNDLGMILLHRVNQPLPKRQGFGVRIVHAKNADSLFAPKFNDAFHFPPYGAPLLGSEIERIDILIFFRRVFGKLNRAVRTPTKPLGMLAHVRMIGAALIGEIERDLEVEAFGLGDKAPELFDSAELRMNGFMAALR